MSAPVQLGPPVLLPSARVGRQVAINRSDKPVYLDLDGKPLCQHGEKQCAHPCFPSLCVLTRSLLLLHAADTKTMPSLGVSMS